MKTTYEKTLALLADARVLAVLRDEHAVRDVPGCGRVLGDPGRDARARIRTGLALELGPDSAATILASLDAVGWSATVDLGDARLAATRAPSPRAMAVVATVPIYLALLLAGSSRGTAMAVGAVAVLGLSFVAGRVVDRRRRARVATREEARWDGHFLDHPCAQYAWKDDERAAGTSVPRSIVDSR